jgi:hypothetical protein
VNPNGGFTEFTKKDPITNLDVYRDARPPPPDLSHLSSKWAVGTQKYTAKTEKVTEQGHLDRTQIDSSKQWPRNKTDNISFEPPPAGDTPLQKVFDEMVTRPKYNINVTSQNGWVPFYAAGAKTVNNRSSVSHNIISNQPNDHTPALVVGLLDKNVTNMRKGVGEYKDLQRVTSIN